MLAFEVWRPGVAGALWRLEEAGVDNVRLISVDAVWSMRHLFEPGSIAELWTFFPDPWPKTRHHKRRLVQPAFVHDAATALSDAGVWRLATDWAEYADSMRAVLDDEPLLDGGVTDRWAGAPAHPVRAPWPGRGPRHHRPDLPAGLIPQGVSSNTRPARASNRSTRSRSRSSSGPGGSTPSSSV